VEGYIYKLEEEADLFDVTHFKSKTKAITELVGDLLFTNDSALVAHHSDMQTLVNKFANAPRL